MSAPSFDEYAQAYEHVVLTREDGILELRLHTDGGPVRWGAAIHEELGHCFATVGRDPANDVVVLTGTGDSFIDTIDGGSFGRMDVDRWAEISADAERLIMSLLDIPVPVIGAVNGPATVHAELALMSDVVIAADRTVFQDAPHFPVGRVPGDGAHVVWMQLLGPNRGRHFLLTGQRLDAQRALELGVVAEVVPADGLVARAHALAREIMRQPAVTRRHTRSLLIDPLRRAMQESLAGGLAREGLAAIAHWPQHG